MRLNRMMKTIILGASITLSMIVAPQKAKADKGMWLLNELNKENIQKLRELGFKLPIDSLYSLKNPSIANAVVIFGGGCTGITVSDKGLIFTNHHCGYSSIQSQSSVEHDYLRDGFVSHSYAEELPIEGLQVKYLSSIEDVTKDIMQGVTNSASINNITIMQQHIQEIEAKANKEVKDKSQEVVIVPYYQYNKFYKITYNVFKDVRMVFAPPSCLGKFGGDTDNWMYPRHTADFSVFRVYASKDNKPAGYSKDNIPYTPKYYATVSSQGYKKGGFAMTIGFPGSTDRYSPSWGIENTIQSENIPRIYVRGIKQAIWKKAMDADQATMIKYASKFAQSSNYWKNAIGMNRGIKRLDVIGRKEKEQAEFQKWADEQQNKAIYGNVLSSLKEEYQSTTVANRDFTYLVEALIRGSEMYKYSNILGMLANPNSKLTQSEKIEVVNKFYKDFSTTLDKQVMLAMLDIVQEKVTNKKYISDIDSAISKAGGTKAFVNNIYSGIVSHPDSLKVLIVENKTANLVDDPAYKYAEDVYKSLTSIRKDISDKSMLIEDNLRLYFAGRRKMDPKRQMPSDANFTMRMSYGSINGYSPADAVWYRYYTTIEGVLQKNATGEQDYELTPSVKQAIENGNWGRWADKKSKTLQTCFISSNDITGGNSGSPVFNGYGRLIGLAFDGNWEAMSGDIEFEPKLQRTIVVDIRYVLWTIDVWGNCPRIINELSLR